HIGKCAGEHLVVAAQRGGRIAVEGCADTRRDIGYGDLFGEENAIAIRKMVHRGYCLGNSLSLPGGGSRSPFLPQAPSGAATAQTTSRIRRRAITGISPARAGPARARCRARCPRNWCGSAPTAPPRGP